MTKELYTSTELAKEFGVHLNSVYNWKRDGMPHQYVGKTLRFDLDEVKAWMNKKEAK